MRREKKPAILITGTSSGIGKACAYKLAMDEYLVFAGARKKQIIEKGMPNLIPIKLDITSEKSIDTVFNIISGIVGKKGLHALVNNAGIAIGGPIEMIPIKDIRNQFEVNLISPIILIQKFLPLLRITSGKIINIGSVSGRVPSPFAGAYSASKYGLEAITDTLHMELKQWGISVSIIEPGRVSTPLWEKSMKKIKELINKAPAGIKKLYKNNLNKANKLRKAGSKSGIDPEVTADIVYEILKSKNPKIHYVIGRDAKLLVFLKKILPPKMFATFICKKLGL